MFNQGRLRVIGLCLADVLGVAAVWSLAVWGYRAAGVGEYDPLVYLRFWPVLVVFAAFNAALDLYHGNWMYPAAALSPVEEMRRLMVSALLSHVLVLAYLAFAYQSTVGVSRFVVSVSGIAVALGAQSFRNWARSLMFKAGVGQIPVVLAGAGSAADKIAAVVSGSTYLGMKIVGRFESLDDAVAESRRRGVRILLVCMDLRLFRLRLEELTKYFAYVEYIPSAEAFPMFGAKIVSFGGIGGVEMVNQGRMRVKRVQKQVLDTLLSALAFAALSPLFVAIPVVIKLTSRGPVFYRQKRLGKGGREFRVWKFRSMHVDADERLRRLLESEPSAAEEWRRSFKLRDDPRVTPFGRFLRRTSLDELPQLFNVLAGEMALIGPRPIVEAEVGYYGESYKAFSSVKPGITGLWQVSGRSDTDYSRRVALDVSYVMNWSPWMDVWILVRTVYAVLCMRGAR